MSYNLTNLTATAIKAGQAVNLGNQGTPGGIVLYNNSQVIFTIDDTDGNQYTLPNGVGDLYPIGQGINSIRMTPIITVSGSTNNANTVSFTFLTVADLKRVGRNYPINLGASFGVSSVNQVINDNFNTSVQVVEAQLQGNGGSQLILTNDGNITMGGKLAFIGAPGTSQIVNIPNMAGVNTSGQFGVPLAGAVVASPVSITSSAQKGILSATGSLVSPSFARVCFYAIVGGSNTNVGSITISMTYTDQVFGAITQQLQNPSGSFYSSLAVAQNVQAFVQPHTVPITAGSSITVTYQNSAAGTISDKAWGSIEFIG